VLRTHTTHDFDDCAAMWGSAEVARYTVGTPSPPQDVWFRLLRYAGHWALLGWGYWVITDRMTGSFLGEGGFADFHRGMPEVDGFPEIGWALAPHAWGRGIATEAVDAMLAWSDVNLATAETRCIIDPDNVASIRVAARCGFVSIGNAEMASGSVGVFNRPRPER
jgi:RimJ/RimL family protein N-acetyltransferase